MKYLICLILILIPITANADILQIGRECYPKQIQARFAEKGYKLELNGENRESDTFGFIVNKGSQYEIVTYKPVTEEQLLDILEISNE